jgi:glucose dehydrogenase
LPQAILFLVGLALVAVGVGLYSLPAGLIVAGLSCAACALMLERHKVARDARQEARP